MKATQMRADQMPDQQTCSLIDGACEKAEKAIQRVLLELEEETGKRVVIVEVDTRNFANLATSIFVK